uniref:Choline transporter-like protein n=1 Tax=Monodelphis domestica TaxID=13616 RepID=A0A5F8GXG6_MONDO
MPCFGGEYLVSAEESPRQREWRPQIYRKCTDPAWLILFFLFWTGLMFIMGYSVIAGAAGRLVFGYDSYGNVCGKKNSPVEGAPLSGQDMTKKKHVFFMNSCYLELKDLQINSIALCVSSCPEQQLDTLEDVQLFAKNNALSLIMMFILRFITTLLLHIFISLVVLGLLFVSGILWWLYYDYINDLSIELDTERENMKCLLAFAIISTVITVVLLILIFVLRERIQLTVDLFQVTSKTISNTPFLLLQPLWTFIILIFFWVLWVAVLLSLGTAGTAQVMAGGRVEYQLLSGIRYMWWYHLIGLIWTSEFILACQQMTIAGAVVTCYFNRNKSDPPRRPILSSLVTLFYYHQGTVVKGSFLITMVRIPRTVFTYLSNTLKEKEDSACTKYIHKCCFCCLWCLDKCLSHLTQNAYIATSINGTDFCTSAKDTLSILSKNPGHVASITCLGDFIIFLGKMFVVYFTVFGGLMAFNYHRELQVWAIPLLLVAFFAYLVAHNFLSAFETVLDTLFLCYVIDMETNDGSPEKPYFMDQELMSFVNRSSKLIDSRIRRNRKSLGNEDGTELQPIVR